MQAMQTKLDYEMKSSHISSASFLIIQKKIKKKKKLKEREFDQKWPTTPTTTVQINKQVKDWI